MTHDSIEDLVPAYALGATDPAESAIVGAHVVECPACQAQLAGYRELGDAMLYTIPLREAPAYLGEALRRQVAPGRQPVTRHERSQGFSIWPGFLRVPVFAWLAAALVLLVGSNVYWAQRATQIEQKSAVQATAIAALAEAPTVELRADAPGVAARGVLYFHGNSNVAVLHTYGLPALATEKVYQVWLVRDDQRDSAGLFVVNEEGEGILLITATRPLKEYQRLGVTVEPAAGSPAPTSPRVIGGSLS